MSLQFALWVRNPHHLIFVIYQLGGRRWRRHRSWFHRNIVHVLVYCYSAIQIKFGSCLMENRRFLELFIFEKKNRWEFFFHLPCVEFQQLLQHLALFYRDYSREFFWIILEKQFSCKLDRFFYCSSFLNLIKLLKVYKVYQAFKA